MSKTCQCSPTKCECAVCGGSLSVGADVSIDIDGETVLAPCPFCGTTDLGEFGLQLFRVNDHANWRKVVCTWCNGEGPPRSTDAEAFEVWNERHRD